MSVRWQHCIYHADKQTNAGKGTRLSSRRSSAADRQSVKRDYAMACRPVLPSSNSRTVLAWSTGQVFAVFAGMQALAEIVSSTLFNNLYPYTLHFWNGLCFLIGAVLCLVPISLAVWVPLWRCRWAWLLSVLLLRFQCVVHSYGMFQICILLI